MKDPIKLEFIRNRAIEAAKAKRGERIRSLAERLYVAAGSAGLFSHCETDEAAARFAFEAAEAFERVAEARDK